MTYDRRWLPVFYLWLILSAVAGCAAPAGGGTPSRGPAATLVLTGGTLIDGTGAAPVANGVVVIGGDRVLDAGPRDGVTVPDGARVIDVTGATIMPGFINAHVHDAYDKGRLRAWAEAGVTTVRDEGILEHKSLAEMLKIRDRLAGKPQFARLVSAGFMLGPPDGYGQFEIPSAAAARQAVNRALDEGADLIKFSVEDGYAGWTGLPVFDDAIINAIVETAHARGARVSVHVCDARYLERVLDAGVDDVAHIQYDYVNKELVRRLVDEEVTIVPTLTVLEAYGSLIGAKANLARFHEAGVRIALGNDYTLKPQNNFDHFELGMPMHEITRMHEAGMSPLAIITAATQNAARVCGLETELGTLEAGKIADALVVRGDPLADLNALTDVRLVVHNGEVIVNEP